MSYFHLRGIGYTADSFCLNFCCSYVQLPRCRVRHALQEVREKGSKSDAAGVACTRGIVRKIGRGLLALL